MTLMMPKMVMLLPIGTSEFRRDRWISALVRSTMARSDRQTMMPSRFLFLSSAGGSPEPAFCWCGSAFVGEVGIRPLYTKRIGISRDGVEW